MKLLVVTNLYPPHALGGYELSCQDVVRRWRSRGHDVSVLTTTTRLRGVADDPAETDVHRQLEWYWSDGDLVRPAPAERLRIERTNRHRLAAVLDAIRPDVVSLWAMGGMSMSLVSLCVERHQPAVAVVEDDWMVYGPNVDAWLSAWSQRPAWLGSIAARITGVPTTPPALPATIPVAFASDYLRRRASGTGSVRFTNSELVTLGIDPTDFPARDNEPRHWRGRLLCVGRVEPRKGFDVVVRALPGLPGTTLHIVGPSDGHLDDLMALGRDLGVADRISSDAVRREELAKIYADADAVIFPSRWDEPFGLVPLEAMSQATPVIATRRGGAAEFLTDGVNCLEIGVDDPAAITAAVRRLAGDPSLRSRLVAAGLKTSGDLHVDRFADRLEALHERARGGGSAPAVAAIADEVTSPTYGGEPPEVSVIVSTHGRAELLSGLLDALERQVDVDAEIVVADNGSPDATWDQLVARAAGSSMRLRAIRLAFHDGPGVPRNTAVSLARGAVLAFTDDDCLPTPTWLRHLVDALADADVTVVQGKTDPEPGGWAGPWSRSLSVSTVSGRFETANLACRRADFERLGGFSPRRLLTGRPFGEDVQLGAGLARLGEVRFAAAALVHHRVLPGSYRDRLAERSRLRGFPALVDEVPELRRHLLGRVFLSRRTLATDIGLAGLAAAATTRRRWPALLAVPWAILCWRGAAGRAGRPRAVRAAQVAASDVVGAAALARGSAEAGRLVL